MRKSSPIGIQEKRSWFANEVRLQAGVTNPAIFRAFSSVAREDYLGPGPWKLGGAAGYEEVQSCEELYHNVVVAIDSDRLLNSAQPSWVAQILQKGKLRSGDRAVHIGGGVGYYTAIMTEVVGEAGSVLSFEVDETLADRAKKNLAHYKNVECLATDASSYSFEPQSADFIFVNAGATHIQIPWIKALTEGGTLLVPLTYAKDEAGSVLKVTNNKGVYKAAFVLSVYVYPCIGSRVEVEAKSLKEVVSKHGWRFEGTLRLDPENADESCWLKSGEYWLSTREK